MVIKEFQLFFLLLVKRLTCDRDKNKQKTSANIIKIKKCVTL